MTVKLTVRDGGLGLQRESSGNANVHIGPCSGGVANTFYAYTSIDKLIEELGYGPLVRVMALDIALVGIAYGVKPTHSASSTPTIAQSGAGPLPTFTGTPKDHARFVMKVKAGGARGTATVLVSWDNGKNYSEELTTAATIADFATKTGLTIAFPTGTYVADEVYTATATPPTVSSGNLVTAIQVACNDVREFRELHIAGTTTGGTAEADFISLCATMDAAVEAFAAAGKRYCDVFMEAPDGTLAAAMTASVGSVAPRVFPCFGYGELESPIDQWQEKRSYAWVIAARCVQFDVQEHPGKVENGPLTSLLKALYHDESLTPGADAARYGTIQTVVGLGGFWVVNARSLAPVGSDYATIEYRAVMNKACKVTRQKLLTYQNTETLEINPTTKCLTEAQARSLDNAVTDHLVENLVGDGNATAARVLFSRSEPIGTSKKLKPKITIVPRGYAGEIEAEIGFGF